VERSSDLELLRGFLLMLAMTVPTLSVLAQATDRVRDAARDEGLVRFAIATCFTSGSPEQIKLNGQSARYIRSLSAASAIPVADLEKLVEDGLAKATATKKLSAEQCKKGRNDTAKLISNRDVELGGGSK
jgi:hypothetical protein